MDNLVLNSEQRRAVDFGRGPLLVLAGAGTGKTQVITSRIAHLIDSQAAKPTEILAITFTDKAAREMETRVAELLGRYILDVKITTFNAYGQSLIERFAYELGYSQDVQLLTQAQQLVFLKDHIDQLKLKYYAPITNPEGLLADLAAYFSKLTSQTITTRQYTKFTQQLKRTAKSASDKLEASRHAELAQAYQTYQQLKRRSNLIDFDDQVGLAVELLSKFANIRTKIQSETKWLLVDEFQDTNPAQSQLIDLLAGKDQNLTVVGDDDQSIYQFRGSAVANILSFADRYPKAKRIALTTNYRSSQSILDAAYQLIQYNNPDRLEAKYQIDKRLHSAVRGPKPVFKSFLNLDDEASFIATDIKDRLKKGEAAQEIAVLLRKNSQAQILTNYLSSVGVESILIGQTADLYRQPVIKLMLNFLASVTDPAHSTSLYHLLASELFNFDSTWLRDQASQSKREHLPLEEILKTVADDSQPELVDFLTNLERWRSQIPNLSVGQLSYQFLSDTNYLHQLIRRARSDPSLDQTIADLNQWFASLGEFERIATDDTVVGYMAALPALLGSGQRLAIEDLPEVFGAKVRLITVHKAKGLEFKTVYLFDLSQDTFPARRMGSSLDLPPELVPSQLDPSASHLAEERRLMYVAMTRAKTNLIMTYSIDHGGKQAKKPSQFITEALGQLPELANFKPKLIATDQIELFRTQTAGVSQGSSLPPNLMRGHRLTLTAHQIEDYLMCPAEFYLRHIIAPPQPASFGLEYGNLLHSLVQLYNRRVIDGQPATLPELLDYLNHNWPKGVFVSPRHATRSLAQARATVTAFYKRESKSLRHPSLIEQPFEFEIDDVNVRGRFDAVYEDGDVEIRDYKTGAATVTDQVKADNRAKTSLQLSIYALAWQQLRGQAPAILSLDFMDTGLIGRTTKTGRQLATVERKIGEVADGIRGGDFRPSGSHIFCTHMDYGF